MMMLFRLANLIFVICRRVQHIILDFRKENEGSLEDLKTQFNLLDNGYSVDLGKVSNSLLQGTLSVIFSILNLPSTNRGYFWNEEDFNGSGISDIFSSCLNLDVQEVEQMLNQSFSTNIIKNDANEIDLDDLDDLDEEEEDDDLLYGPSLPTKVFTKEAEEDGQRMVGPVIPDGFVLSID